MPNHVVYELVYIGKRFRAGPVIVPGHEEEGRGIQKRGKIVLGCVFHVLETSRAE